MQTEVALIAAIAITILFWLAQSLGVFKVSYRESLNDGLDAVYVRHGLLTWELLITAKGKEVGVKQGTYLLPFAKSRAELVRQGKRTIL